jgi:hypothetical protein
MNSLRIRPMRPDEISIAVNGATAEGWNPGLADDACFAAADPEGFFIGELEGAPAATVGSRVIGLDGVLAQQQNYTKSGSSSLMPTSDSGLV